MNQILRVQWCMDVYIDVNVELSREFSLKNNELYFGTYTLLRIQKMKKKMALQKSQQVKRGLRAMLLLDFLRHLAG